MGYLSAYLKERQHVVKVFDLNTEIDVPYDSDEQKWCSREFVEGYIFERQNVVNSLVDEILESDPHVIGFSVWTTIRYASLILAKIIKQRDKDKIIIFGGPECSFTGNDLIRQEQVDVVIYGEGEKTLVK